MIKNRYKPTNYHKRRHTFVYSAALHYLCIRQSASRHNSQTSLEILLSLCIIFALNTKYNKHNIQNEYEQDYRTFRNRISHSARWNGVVQRMASGCSGKQCRRTRTARCRLDASGNLAGTYRQDENRHRQALGYQHSADVSGDRPAHENSDRQRCTGGVHVGRQSETLYTTTS